MPVPTHARGQVKLCDMGLARMCEKSRLLLTICGLCSLAPLPLLYMVPQERAPPQDEKQA